MVGSGYACGSFPQTSRTWTGFPLQFLVSRSDSTRVGTGSRHETYINLWGAVRAGANTLGVRITDVRIHKQTVDSRLKQLIGTRKYTCTNYSASSFLVLTALTQEWKVGYNLWLIRYVSPSNPLSLGASYSMHQTTIIYTATSIMKNKAAEIIGLHSWLYTAYSPNSECSEGKYDFFKMHLPKLPTVNIQL